METKNLQLLNKDANRDYYSKSDSQFMPIQHATKAHQILDRVKWVRENVHELDSHYHLDVGCKDGYTCLTLASEGINCMAIDPSEDAIIEATLRNSELQLDCVFKTAFIEDFDVDMKFDTVSMMEVLEHVVDVDVVLKKLCKLGRFVMITTPDADGAHGMVDSEQNIEHVRMFTKQELQDLVEKYGTVIDYQVRDGQLCIAFKANEK